MSALDDPLATDDELDRALGIPTMSEILGRVSPISPDNFALRLRSSSLGRNRGGNASGSSSPGAPDYHPENDKNTDYETGDTMQNDTQEHPDN